MLAELSLVTAADAKPAKQSRASAQSAAQRTTAPMAPRGMADLRVASFNIQNVSLDRTSGTQRPWRTRRAAVINTIMRDHPAIIGLQEANTSRFYSNRLVSGKTQWRDLMSGLNARGGHYRATAMKNYNCLRPWTSSRCQYRNHGASGPERILYDARKLGMVSRGNLTYARQGRNTAQAAWAVLKIRSTGRHILVANTHLDPSGPTVRWAQLAQLRALVDRINGNMPTIVLGDFNIHKYSPEASALFGGYKAAGFGEVLNQQYRVNPSRNMRAEKRTNAWVHSQNKGQLWVQRFSYWNARQKTGNSIDHIFASNRIRVLDYKLSVDRNNSGKLVGVVPSDHAMISAMLRIGS